ncbi:MAG: synthase subunit gamma [Bacteroidota bacterium]|jgi:F-type H+-transporting ATPase subunit gamma
MPGQLKEVRGRIASVTSTQQITKAMKMVSAAKLRRAQDRITQMRPYSRKLSEMLQNIVSGESNVEIKLAQPRAEDKILIVLMTSDRGLCGGFNSNLIKTVKNTINEKYAAQLQKNNVEILCVGKKGLDTFKKTNKVNADFVSLGAKISFDETSAAAEKIMNDYINGVYDKVEIVYSQFKNAGTQIFQAEQFLPVAKTISTDTTTKSTQNSEFIFQPSKTELINELVPKILKTQFYKCLADTIASEHGARMTAMDKATENASELLKDLKLKYNRARQAAITTELTEIVSGAAALQG